jgi:hypothetical protein
MTDRDVLERVGQLTGCSVYDIPITKRNECWQPSYRVMIHFEQAAQLMRQLRPLMCARRQQQIDAALTAREAALDPRRRPRLKPRHYREIAQRLDAGERATDLAAEFDIAREYVYRAARKGRAA